jgi:predicted RNase H-like HicB family nuclease
MRFTIECEQEEDGRWIAEVLELPGVLVYGRTPEDARTKARSLGLRVLADRIEQDEDSPALMSISFAFA